ncbi:hypothetical protein QYE76_022720 [Lolium multiflorum]|uniref:Uncharacterized protein n=1 Tax=Lolium multiflorum TaxID=4521 RepID=A0AAD8RDA4_LOLMU|nr:hypothetical protein QYE76_022720 [Lolium multiflorum]
MGFAAAASRNVFRIVALGTGGFATEALSRRKDTFATYQEHLQHVAIIFNELRAHHLHLKRSKCSFGTTSIAYLGHVITAEGDAMDADKVAAVAGWPTPQSQRALRGFLGLAGYYRSTSRTLASSPCLDRLRTAAPWPGTRGNGGLLCARRALTTGPVLRMPDFDLPFVVDRDTSASGSAPSSINGGRPSSAGRSPLAISSLRRTSASSLGWFRLCAIGGPTSPVISKLFGFDFTVEYCPGRLNTVADALSRHDTEELADSLDGGIVMCIRSGPPFAFIDDIRRATVGAADAQALHQRLTR